MNRIVRAEKQAKLREVGERRDIFNPVAAHIQNLQIRKTARKREIRESAVLQPELPESLAVRELHKRRCVPHRTVIAANLYPALISENP